MAASPSIKKTTKASSKPTVFDNMNSNMELMNLETFGPIIPIQKIKTLDEAIELSNNSMYGPSNSFSI